MTSQALLGRTTATLNCEEMAAHPRIQENSLVELHGVSDASQQAMAVVLYIKTKTCTSQFNFIISHLQNKGDTIRTTFNPLIGIRSGSFTHEVGKTRIG